MIEHQPKRELLYFGPSGIGDWCVIYPGLANLLEKHECQSATVIIPHRNEGNELLANSTLIGEVKYLDRATHGTELLSYAKRWVELLLHIRSRKFPVLAVSYLSNQPDTLSLAALSGIPIRIGVVTNALARNVFNRTVARDPTIGKLAAHLAYSQDIRLPADSNTLFAEAADAEVAIPPQPYVVLAIGGGRNATWRFWPARHWHALISALPDVVFVLLGGGLDDERQSREIARLGRLTNVIDLVGNVSMRGAVELVRSSRAVVGNDSGLANIAASLKVPTLCLYGPTDPRLTGPALIGAVPLSISVPCGPCFGDDQDPTVARKCPHHACLAQLQPTVVARKLMAIAG